ncbi:NADP-dependent malic enzyme [Candidatus Bipolaricaulota bacterium]|nr:NADP-dependent malic enzyme [Candidatus Bipolaricaulota bacterium]
MDRNASHEDGNDQIEPCKQTKRDLDRADRLSRVSPGLHRFYQGKLRTGLKCVVRGLDDYGIWYTPGVAASCKEIAQDPQKVLCYTNKANAVAVVSDGSRVLGLGNIGAKAALPVMEGKALLFKHLGGIDAYPIVLDTQDPDEIIRAVAWISPGFGGINLEDLATPKCFRILESLRERLDIPVWHDDQQGTAAVTLAGVLNALRVVGKRMNDVSFCILGTGAANLAFLRILLLHSGNVDPKRVILVDSHGIVHPGRQDAAQAMQTNPTKWEYAAITNGDGRRGGLREALVGADVLIAAACPGPDAFEAKWIKAMAPDAIAFLLANPVPEIWPWEAKKAGARIVGTGRSDFPNQINNSLGFPGIFRGTLDVQARTITDEMTIAAAEAIASAATCGGASLSESWLVPTMMDVDVVVEVAVAVGGKAIEQSLARCPLSEQDRRETAKRRITDAQQETEILMREGHIPLPPKNMDIHPDMDVP